MTPCEEPHGGRAAVQEDDDLCLRRAARAGSGRGAHRRQQPQPLHLQGHQYLPARQGRTLALIDPGPEDPAHLKAILDTVGERQISHVIITHTHRDHTDGMPALLAATGAKTVGFGHRATNRGTKRTSPSGGEYVEEDFVPDVPLLDGQRLRGGRLGGHGAAHAGARARSPVLRAGGHQDPVLRRSRDGLEHQRGRRRPKATWATTSARCRS